MRLVASVLVVAACSGARPAPGHDAAPAPVPAPAPVTVPDRIWFSADLHMHVSPPDRADDVELSIDEIAERARDAGIAVIVLTPHLNDSTWRSRAKRKAFLAKWRALAARAAEITTPTMIPGIEYGVSGVGHFTVAGVDLATIDDDDLLTAARAAGAFVSVNHPYAVPTRIPGIPESRYDLSYRPWSRGGRGFDDLVGVEVWNVPLGLANLVSRPGGASGEQRAWIAADRLARERRRHVAAVGGTDNHLAFVAPTTWIRASDASASSILAALHAGATCVGGDAAGTLEAHGARIGEDASTAPPVTLRWTGAAELFIDGVSAGTHDDGFVHDAAPGRHTYRIEQDASRCGFVYVDVRAP